MVSLRPNDEPWYKAAFRGHYLALYAHRDGQEARTLADLARRVTGLQPGASVADIPCGAGRHLRAFEEIGWKCAGLDLSQDLLRSAASAGQESKLVRGDIRALPLPSGQFDLVANVFTSIGYFESDEENAMALMGLARLVKPGGWLLVDFLDAGHVAATLKTETRKTTPEGWEILERRAILSPDSTRGQTVPRVRKTIRIQRPADQAASEHFEEVALLDEAWFRGVFARAGLVVRLHCHAYDGREAPQGGECPNRRLILFGQKEMVPPTGFEPVLQP